MFSSILDKILSVALGLALLGGGGALWYADHEHAKSQQMQMVAQQAATAAKQAAIDRDAAIKSAADAELQMKVAQAAQATAASAASAAQADAKDARGKLATAGKIPAIARVLDTQLPPQVWNAINNEPGN